MVSAPGQRVGRALFDSGSSIGAALAPLIVLSVHNMTGSWRPRLS